MNTYSSNDANKNIRTPTWSFLIVSLLASLLAGCYMPTQGIRDPNPGPTASPPWPYDPTVYPPGQNTPAAQRPYYQANSAASPIPDSQTLYMGASTYGRPYTPNGNPGTATPPPPSQSTPPQYADWLVDGPEGRGFAYYLATGYRRYAKHEDNVHDFEDAAKFLFRAGAVDRGEHVEPELLSMRTLPAYSVDDLLYARQRLMAVFNRGAANRFPKLSASAQVNFDCWMEQQEENLQPHNIAQCRRGFEADIVRLETALIERIQTSPPVQCPPPPPAKPACDSTPHFVLFDLGKHDLTAAGKEVLLQMVEYSKRSGNLPLIVTAHTDRAGSDTYNEALSRRRLNTVLSALEAAGMARDKLARADYFGEMKLRVETPDGVRNKENRRVEIRLACDLPSSQTSCGRQPEPAMPSCGGHPTGCTAAPGAY